MLIEGVVLEAVVEHPPYPVEVAFLRVLLPSSCIAASVASSAVGSFAGLVH